MINITLRSSYRIQKRISMVHKRVRKSESANKQLIYVLKVFG